MAKLDEFDVKANLVRILQANPSGVSLENLSKQTGVTSKSQLKQLLRSLELVGVYPRDPGSLFSLEIRKDHVRLLSSGIPNLPTEIGSNEIYELQKYFAGVELSEKLPKTLKELKEKLNAHLRLEEQKISELEEKIQDAISTKKVIEFEYQKRGSSKFAKKIVSPIRIFTNNEIYFVGFSHLDEAKRMYRIQACINLKILSNRKYIDFPDALSFDSNEVLVPIVAEISFPPTIQFEIRKWFLVETPFEKREGSSWLVAKVPVIHSNWLLDTVLSFGNKCILLSPEEFRNVILNTIDEKNLTSID